MEIVREQCETCNILPVRKGVVGWEIIPLPQGRRDSFGQLKLESENWAAPGHIW